MADTALASRIATEIARLLHGELNEISRAVARNTGQVSFSATCVFSRSKDDVLQCKIEPRKRIPILPVVLKLDTVNGQLSLFEAELTADPSGTNEE